MRGKGRWIVLALVLGLSAWLGWQWLGGGEGATQVTRVERVVPESMRIRVEVMNASGTRGLARRATTMLRDAGFDVVGSGNWTERLDSNLVLVRGGDTTWASIAACSGPRGGRRPSRSTRS
jgi:hypothetical protein